MKNIEPIESNSDETRKEPNLWRRIIGLKGYKGWAIKALLILLSFMLLTSGILEIYLLSIRPKDLVLSPVGDSQYINTLLIGLDAGLLPDGSTMPSRSDVLMLISFNRQTKEALLLSIPRDTMVYYDDLGSNRINAAHVFGNSELVVNKVEELLETDVHYLAKVNFKGFQALVDAIGGISLYVEKDMEYYDPYDVPPLIIDLKEGYQKLDGNKAEQYVRYRDEMGDIGRVERQQKFVNAFFKRLINPVSWLKLPFLALTMKDYLQTNLHINNGISLTWRYLFSKEVYKSTLPGYGEYFNGASYWIPTGLSLQEIFEQIKFD